MVIEYYFGFHRVNSFCFCQTEELSFNCKHFGEECIRVAHSKATHNVCLLVLDFATGIKRN